MQQGSQSSLPAGVRKEKASAIAEKVLVYSPKSHERQIDPSTGHAVAGGSSQKSNVLKGRSSSYDAVTLRGSGVFGGGRENVTQWKVPERGHHISSRINRWLSGRD